MYIVRWLLSHPIIATWVALSVVAILLIFGSGEKDEMLASVNSPATDKVETNRIEENKRSATSSVDSVDKAEKANTATIQEVEKADKHSAMVTDSVTPPLESELDDVKLSSDSVTTKTSATTDISQATIEEMLLMAREAYWNNGLDEAAQIYNKLIEKEPKVLEYKGELGNVYWRQGYPEKAAELYSEIAIPMIESGKTERVANMIGFIGLFFPDRAAEIHKKMQANK